MSSWLADIVLAAAALEFVGIVIWHRRTGRGIAPADLASALLPGVFLVLALREALVGAWWGWVGVCLLAAGLAHGADLRRRWVKR